MKKISLKKCFEDYSGFIVKDKNGLWYWRNSNDMGIFGELADLEVEIREVKKVHKFENLKIIELKSEDYDDFRDGYFEHQIVRSEEEAIKEIAKCYKI